MNISYVRGYSDPHKSLKILSTAARTLSGMVVMRVPMHVPEKYKNLQGNKLVTMAFKLFGHLILVKRIAQAPPGNILIREFLTLPLLAISPLLFSRRRRLWFLCNHNISFAASNAIHRHALKFLRNIGFRFVLYDDRSGWEAVEKGEIPLSSVCTIPSPMPKIPDTEQDKNTKNNLIKIGFIGNFRKEKSPRWAVEKLLPELGESGVLSGCSLLIGTSDPDLRARFAHVAEVVDTSSYQAFLEALHACDVVVLPYDPVSYAYRVSGVLSEAVACGCAIVVPDIQSLRDQISQPALVGACYANGNSIVEAVKSAITLVRDSHFQDAIELHKRHRGQESLRQVLSAMSS